jgi:hypothetical protein
LQFELMVDWVDQPLLEDLALNWDASRRRALQLKVGQFKVPFGTPGADLRHRAAVRRPLDRERRVREGP